MRASDVIQRANDLVPNMFEDNDKLQWLFELDLRIRQEILDSHAYNEGETVDPAVVREDYTQDKELLVGDPWSDLYLHWLEAKIAYYNRETNSFNDANAMFSTVYTNFANAYNRTHLPLTGRKRYF